MATKKETSSTKKSTATKTVTKAAPPKEKKTVTIHLFKDTGKYSGDLMVGLNGKFYTVQRGVDVEVPIGVAEIIKNSMAQDQATQEEIARITQK